MPEKTIYRIETGEVQDPRLSTVKPILSALRCSAAIIFDEDEVFGEDDLTKSFIHADALPKEEQKTIAEIVRRWTMVGYMEKYFPNEFLKQVLDSERHRELENREREIE